MPVGDFLSALGLDSVAVFFIRGPCLEVCILTSPSLPIKPFKGCSQLLKPYLKRAQCDEKPPNHFLPVWSTTGRALLRSLQSRQNVQNLVLNRIADQTGGIVDVEL